MAKAFASLRLKPGREKSLLRRHPWIFSGAISHVDGNPQAGETVAIRDSNGKFLASAAYSPRSQISARVWSFDEGQRIDERFFRDSLARAISSRNFNEALGAVRLVHAESDGLPGVTVDRYADAIVVQLSSAGADAAREIIADALFELIRPKSIYERSDVEARKFEGLPPKTGTLRGAEPCEQIAIVENGLTFLVDVRNGHKTGFYLDQRENRRIVREMSAGREVLDCFCYTGGFAIGSAAGGARSVLAIDSSASALALAQKNADRNGQYGIEWREADVFEMLRTLRDQGRRFDFIVLDPPKFAPNARLVERGGRAYKDINLLAFKLLRDSGMLATFSCSGGVSAELFQKIVAGAAQDASASAQIVARLHAAADHPVALNFPEAEYLKGLLCKTMR